MLELHDPSRVKHAKPFEGQFPAWNPPQIVGNKPAQRFRLLLSTLQNILFGSDNQVIMTITLKDLMEVLKDGDLPYGEWAAHHATLASRMPPKLDTALGSLIDKAHAKHFEFPSKQLLKSYDACSKDNESFKEAELSRAGLEPLMDVMEAYKDGLRAHERQVVGDCSSNTGIFKRPLAGQDTRKHDILLRLRDENRDDSHNLVQISLLHSRIVAKNNLVFALLEVVRQSKTDISKQFGGALKRLSELAAR
jgi:acetyl-CoA carboxylase/biotin carboxylase 1